MKYVYVYYQRDLENDDIYIVGVFTRDKDVVTAMDNDIKDLCERNGYDYETARDSFDVPFDIAAECHLRLYLHERLEWVISIEELNEGGN